MASRRAVSPTCSTHNDTGRHRTRVHRYRPFAKVWNVDPIKPRDFQWSHTGQKLFAAPLPPTVTVTASASIEFSTEVTHLVTPSGSSGCLVLLVRKK